MRCFNLYQARFAAKLAYFAAKFSTVVRLARVNLNFLGPENVRKEVFCCRDLVSTAWPDLQEVLVAGIWLQLPAPDLQGVFVAGIMLQLPALNLQEVLLQGFCFNCLPWI